MSDNNNFSEKWELFSKTCLTSKLIENVSLVAQNLKQCDYNVITSGIEHKTMVLVYLIPISRDFSVSVPSPLRILVRKVRRNNIYLFICSLSLRNSLKTPRNTLQTHNVL